MSDDREPVVRVQGMATARAIPDRAEVHLTVSAAGPDRAAALTATSAKADAVGALLRDAGLPEGSWRTSGVRVNPEYEWVENRRVLTAYRAVAQFTVVVRDDLSVVDVVVGHAVARADADVDGPYWTVSPGNRARLEAYTQAALDARARADAYARALGRGLGPVVRIDEQNDQGGRPQPRMMMAAMPAEQPAETVHVGEVDIEAAVTVTFALREASS